MELFEAIRARHCYRGEFLSDPVPRADLEKMLEAAAAAPSGCNRELTEFVAVDDPALRRRIADLIPGKAFLQTAPAFIVVASDPTPVFSGMAFELSDSAAATQNLLLAITALGYATVWLDGYLRHDGVDAALAGLLGLPSPKVARILLPVGRPAHPVTGPDKKPWTARTHWNGWGRL